MGHLTYQSYSRLQRRLAQYAPGTYNSDTLFKILQVLVTDEEARLASVMPLNLASPAAMAEVWQKSETEAREVLEGLAKKGLVYVFLAKGQKAYALAPPVLGFFEFSLMRTDGRFDPKVLAELYHQYCNVEGDFIRQQGSAQTSFTRVFAHEDALEHTTSEIMSWDRISAGIDAATCISTGACYCRHKMEHLGKACDAPMDVCLTFNGTARYLSEYGIAREISKDEARRIIRQCMEHGLVQIGENQKQSLVVICNCCGCCCDLLLGYKRFGSKGLVSPSAFEAQIDPATCNGCGDCVEHCPVDAMKLEGDKAVVDRAVCLGCGVCTRFCSLEACTMANRPVRPDIPEDFLEKIACSAIETGKLGNYLFDDQTSRRHAVMREVVNTTIRIPWVKKALLLPPIRKRILDAVRTSERYRDV